MIPPADRIADDGDRATAHDEAFRARALAHHALAASHAGGNPLHPCPLCGTSEGYSLSEGETFRWWEVVCRGCGESITECRSDPNTPHRVGPPDRHPNADAAWQEATKHYAMVCANVDRLIARVAQLEFLLSGCVDSLAGYRREHGHEQACDAEAAARAELEARRV